MEAPARFRAKDLFGMRRVKAVTAKALVTALCAAVAPAIAPARDYISFAAGAVSTPSTTYTVNDPSSKENCDFRNGEKLFCPDDAMTTISLGVPIRTRDHILISVYYACNSASPICWSEGVALIIDGRQGARIVKLVDDCMGCDVRPIAISQLQDGALLQVGRKNGYNISAGFRGKSVAIRRTKLSKKSRCPMPYVPISMACSKVHALPNPMANACQLTGLSDEQDSALLQRS
jgi:hypothetical protein